MIFPAPTIAPSLRQPDTIAAASAFRLNDLVWAWSTADAQWRPGIVNAGSDTALLVTYRRPGGGTGVDCLLPRHVMPRAANGDQNHSGITDRGLPLRLNAIPSTSATSAWHTGPQLGSSQKGLP